MCIRDRLQILADNALIIRHCEIAAFHLHGDIFFIHKIADHISLIVWRRQVVTPVIIKPLTGRDRLLL